MNRLGSILPKYIQILRGKSLRQLDDESKRYGLGKPSLNRQTRINMIIQRITKYEKLANDLIKRMEKMESEETQIQKIQYENFNLPSQKRSERYKNQINSQIIRFDSQYLKKISQAQQNYMNQYALRYSQSNLLYQFMPELPPAQKSYIKKQLKEIKKNLLKTQKQQEKNVNKKQQSQQHSFKDYKRPRLAFENDIQQNKNIRQNQWLNSLNIQTQIIYPSFSSLKDYQNSQSDLKDSLMKQYTTSFNAYINKELPKQLQKMRREYKNSYEVRVKKLSQALFLMRLIKQYKCNQKDYMKDFVNAIKSSDKITAQFKIQEFDQLLKSYFQYQDYYLQLLLQQSLQTQIEFIRVIQRGIQIQSNLQKEISHSNFIQRSFNFLFKFIDKLLIKMNQQKVANLSAVNSEKQTMDLRRICQDLINKWLKYSQVKRIYHIDELNNMLQGMRNLDDLISTLTQLFEFDATHLYDEKYENIVKQIIYSMQKIFQNQQLQSPIFPPRLVNSIISNFQAVFGQQQLPQQIIINCVVNSYTVISDLEIQTLKSLIKLLSTRQVIKSKLFNQMTIESLIKNCIGLNVRETLLAIQIAVNYNIKNKENVISNLIFNNINLDESSDQVQNYLLKIINSNIKKPNLKHQLIQYLS